GFVALVELADEHGGVRVGAIGDEGLRAVEDVLVAVAACGRLHATERVGTRVRLHAPILSSVRRSSAHRSFCSIVPLPMMAAGVSPTLTPIAVTMPGEQRQSSMIGIMNMAPPPPDGRSSSSDAVALPSAAARSRSMRFLNCSRASASSPKVWNILRSTSYGAVSPNSSSSRCGRISLSTNWRTASRTMACSSLHSYIAPPQLDLDDPTRLSSLAYGANNSAAAAPISS